MDNNYEKEQKAFAELYKKLNSSQMQQKQQQQHDCIKDMQERISTLWKLHDDLNVYVRSTIYDELEKCKRQYAELRNQSLTTVESVNEYMNAFQLGHYIPSHPKPSTIRVWCCHDIIPHHKMNGKLVFVKSEIDEWLKSKLWEE